MSAKTPTFLKRALARIAQVNWRAFFPRRTLRILLIMLCMGFCGGLWAALRWQSLEQSRIGCLSNERRLATALLLYGQDHDGRLPPPEYLLADGSWRHWVNILQPYISKEAIVNCPLDGASEAREPFQNYPYPVSYALNARFFGVFGPGPFPIENLEIPAQTVLLVESGGYWEKGADGKRRGPWSMSVYTDMAQFPPAYPSRHKNKMNVTAADGHVEWVLIAHYLPVDHDPQFGRVGGAIYNWNAGHPNGDTGGPPRE